ncbi:MAG: triose-phosphate isomerase [Bacteroidales bacterium]|jgi:triosephosphate isomerase|nr:triose-phosphate isomerase [Bacteroidales bacterium]
MRKKIVAGNWKMNKNYNEGIDLVNQLKELKNSTPKDVQLIIAPPFIHLTEISKQLKGTNIKLAAQNCADNEKGAFTGEISAEMIKSTGAEYVIIGHSERRSLYSENNEILNKKTKLALQNQLQVIFCCGENLDERENNKQFEIVKSQLSEGILDLNETDISNIIVAYEPIWAIGTGKTASAEQAQEMHKYIRQLISEKYNQEIADNTTILYGGSCKPENAKELFAKKDVDGGLIGGASLKAKDFTEISKSY